MASPGLLIMTGARGQTTVSSVWSALTAAGGNLVLNNAGYTTEFDQTSGVNWTWANVTPATSSVSQSSPVHVFSGQYWNGSASATDSWMIQDTVSNGANGNSTLTFTHSGSSGPSQVSVPALLVAGGPVSLGEIIATSRGLCGN